MCLILHVKETRVRVYRFSVMHVDFFFIRHKVIRTRFIVAIIKYHNDATSSKKMYDNSQRLYINLSPISELGHFSFTLTKNRRFHR